MRNPLSKIPFLFLLVPLLLGILLQYYFDIQYISIAFFLSGGMAMLFSYLIGDKYQYTLRWLFGVGAGLFIIGIGIVSTSICQQRSEYTFIHEARLYRGVVTDTPQEKPNSTAYRVYLPDEQKQIVCYLRHDSAGVNPLSPGQEFLFFSEIQPFRNMGNPDDFDYMSYMYNQGFVGSTYIDRYSWMVTGEWSSSLRYTALRCRQQIMDFYGSLGLDENEYAILTALTLGYKDELSDDLVQGFRTTGTVHVLSVSGLHVGIIYLMISFLLGFIRKGTRYYRLKPFFIILLLWIYAFITGLSPSVIRASTMLSIFCLSEIFGRRSFSVHALYIAAFFMLLVNPFQLFHIGFQLSFLSVLSILYLQPWASGLLSVSNKYLQKIWQMFTLSVVAQLATYPLCLYYFGTFPTYFFITNILIVPLVMLITYSAGAIVIAKFMSIALPDYSYYIYYLPVKILQFLVQLMITIIHFFESLPNALVENMKISFFAVVLIFAMIVCFLTFFIYKKIRSLKLGFICIFLMLTVHIYGNLKTNPNMLTVYHRRQATEMKWNIGKTEYILKGATDKDYQFIQTGENRLVLLFSDISVNKCTEDKLKINQLMLAGDNAFSMNSLMGIFLPETVILDGSLPAYTRRRLTKECQNLNIPYHDVVESGAFSLNF